MAGDEDIGAEKGQDRWRSAGRGDQGLPEEEFWLNGLPHRPFRASDRTLVRGGRLELAACSPVGNVEGPPIVDEVVADQVAEDPTAERVGEPVDERLFDAGGFEEVGLAVYDAIFRASDSQSGGRRKAAPFSPPQG